MELHMVMKDHWNVRSDVIRGAFFFQEKKVIIRQIWVQINKLIANLEIMKKFLKSARSSLGHVHLIRYPKYSRAKS